VERPNIYPNLIARQTLEAEWNVAYGETSTLTLGNLASSSSFLSHFITAISYRNLCSLLLIRWDPLSLSRFLSYALKFSHANTATWKFCRLYARISLLREKLMHKVYKVFISRFLVLLEISNSCSPSLLNKYEITFREWTSQGGRASLGTLQRETYPLIRPSLTHVGILLRTYVHIR